MFIDRIDAAQQLRDELAAYNNAKETVIVALPRGGVVLGYVLARELNLPLEVAMVKKLAHPANPEYAIGAVSLTGRILNGHHGVDELYIEKATNEVRDLLRKRYQMYHKEKTPVNFAGKTVIVVDDGIATGKTMIAALELITNEKPKRIVVAVPVGPTSTIDLLAEYADEVICLESNPTFFAIGEYYDDFSEVTDKEVIELLEKVDV